MNRSWSAGMALMAGLALPAAPAAARAGGARPQPCPLVFQEEQVELEEARLALDLARSEFASYEKIFRLIEGLWEGKVIEEMTYLEARHDRDAAKLALERAALVVDRQEALVERFRRVCGAGPPDEDEDRSGPEDPVILRYRRAHCDSLAKAAEGAEVNLEFNRVLLAHVLELRAAKVATRPEVILAELQVEKEEKRLADARLRAEACRSRTGKGNRDRND